MLKKDLLHIHDAWCDINRSTPVLAKKNENNLFKSLNLANYQFTEVTGEQ